jgi:hypothetical protein
MDPHTTDPRPSAVEPPDDLGTASVTTGRLRRLLTGSSGAGRASHGSAASGPPARVDASSGSRRTELVDAWHLSAGDELPDGVRVVSVHREERDRVVHILTDEPSSTELPGDSPVPVLRRLL